MGTGDWAAGRLRRALTGVLSVLPGGSEPVKGERAQGAALSGDSTVEEQAPEEGAPDVEAPTEAPPEKAPVQVAMTQEARKQSVPAKDVPTSPTVPARSDEERAGFRAALEADVVRLREELHMGQADLDALLSDAGERAGDDQADAGSRTLDREQEMSVFANAHELLQQSMHALARLDAGTYGICESCGATIPVARLRAFPRATLCIRCKQSEERR